MAPFFILKWPIVWFFKRGTNKTRHSSIIFIIYMRSRGGCACNILSFFVVWFFFLPKMESCLQPWIFFMEKKEKFKLYLTFQSESYRSSFSIKKNLKTNLNQSFAANSQNFCALFTVNLSVEAHSNNVKKSVKFIELMQFLN